MPLFDIAILFAASLLLVMRLNVITCLGERLALALLTFFLLKGLEMFLLVAMGTPGLMQQLLLSVVVLGIALTLQMGKKRLAGEAAPSAIMPAVRSFKMKVAAVVLMLFISSLAAALWFPVSAPDGIWYQIRAWDFLHDSGFSALHTATQYRQYPPLVPLLFAWLESANWPWVKVLFPVTYLALATVVYYRLREATRSEELAGWMTLLFASTPYFWWHSQLGLLNFMSGAFFALGGLYWYTLVERWTDEALRQAPLLPWALVSGLGFGAACWVRPEFGLYSGMALLLLMELLHRYPNHDRPGADHVFPVFAVAALGLPTLWAAVLLAVVPGVHSTGMGSVGLIFLGWVLTLVWGLGWFVGSRRQLIILMVAGGLGFLAMLFVGPQTSLTPATAVLMGLFRTIGFQVFFAFSFLLWAPALTARWSRLTVAHRYLMLFLLGYLLVHLMVYTLLPLKSLNAAQFFGTPMISPGDAVNSSDTREYLAWYPVFIFWVACLPKIRKAFQNA